MNIFILSTNPIKCAEYHCDKHVVKMVLESCQILSTVIQNKLGRKPGLYKSTHVNHPCVKWCEESLGNFIWLWELFVFLNKEYEYRYGKKHKCSEFIVEILNFTIILKFSKKERTEFVQCMPEKYRNESVVKAYRNYYRGEKLKIAKYTKREVPRFMRD